MPYREGMKREPGKHDYSGNHRPYPDGRPFLGSNTFSVGIFQWEKSADCMTLTKTAVKYRIKGYTSNPEAVYRRAAEVCKAMDEGWVPTKKGELVR